MKISSLEISKLWGKAHGDVMQAIRKTYPAIQPNKYKDKHNRMQPHIELGEAELNEFLDEQAQRSRHFGFDRARKKILNRFYEAE